MSGSSVLDKHPSSSAFVSLSRSAPNNPFLTIHYARARERMGSTAWLISLPCEDGTPCLFPAFFRSSRLDRALDIPSAPAAVPEQIFTEAVASICRNNCINTLSVNSYCSAEKPPLIFPEPAQTSVRREYVMSLSANNPSFSTAHIRNLKKARKAGLELRIASDVDACMEHLQLYSDSVTRRVERGDDIDTAESPSWLVPFIEERAGAVFQAAAGKKIVASSIILLSLRGAYYFSSGVSEEGRCVGAAHFIVACAAQYFAAQKFITFNLGGAGEREPGLARFKAGFGAKEVVLASADYRMGSWMGRIVDYLNLTSRRQRAVQTRPFNDLAS